ncbi:TonB-dependent receptor [uncultured Methylibium sp.]|uniref:TonB-dependent receptor n=1 Tax=uncultured Methylibium sp. TaxID=381093 RepID=UPI0025E5EFDD|nr:TonB-dependent receptor [uncultured Methylibium sp.]
MQHRLTPRVRPRVATLSLALAAACAFPTARAGGEQTLERVVVKGSATEQVGVAEAASVGTVTQKQLEARTVYRSGELLEATPGLVVSQHSGEGKANQFYLRGFNLDHGTDLRTSVDGMLVNQRTHAHGQGWTDLNFLIPELATGLRYKKGTYDAAEGDFASAGAVEVLYADRLERGIASIGLGQNGYRRVLLADSPAVGDGHLLYALEGMRNDGPFVNPDGYRRFNGVLRYSRGDRANGWNVTLMAYDAKWNATDQIPKRAVDAGQLDRFDTIDTSDGGQAQRHSLSGEWRRTDEASATRLNAYVVASRLDLYSNFTYFLDDEVNGDQFAQPDRRVTTGVNASHTLATPLLGRAAETTFGAQFQNDNIHNGLLRTVRRETIGTTRRDHVVESSLGLYVQTLVPWTPSFRTVAGVRADHYRFDVQSDNPANPGKANDTLVSPKLSLIFGPFGSTEFYLNAGTGFHSNDARGTTISVDPASGDPVDKVTPLVRSKGYELGARTSLIPGLQTSLSLYRLDIDSELLFIGDAGGTEATRPSRRTGFELANYYRLNDWLTVDADIAFARARFKDAAPEGRRIPGAVEGVASLAIAVDNLGPWFGALQARWFGPRPLLEDNSVRSKSTATLNGRIGYKLTRDLSVELEGYNLANRKASAIDYYYESRLASEPSGVATPDIHFHPIESRSFRVTMVLRY